MRPDSDIKHDVESELNWDPDIDAADIGVAVENGVVTPKAYAAAPGESRSATPSSRMSRYCCHRERTSHSISFRDGP